MNPDYNPAVRAAPDTRPDSGATAGWAVKSGIGLAQYATMCGRPRPEASQSTFRKKGGGRADFTGWLGGSVVLSYTR